MGFFKYCLLGVALINTGCIYKFHYQYYKHIFYVKKKPFNLSVEVCFRHAMFEAVMAM